MNETTEQEITEQEISEQEALELEELEELERLEQEEAQEMREANKPTKMGKGKSALKGAADEMSLGFNDEAGGAAMGFYSWLKEGIQGSSNLSLKELKSKYKTYRDLIRSDKEKAQRDNPKSYTAGGITGIVGTGLGGVGKSVVKKGASKLFGKAAAKQGAKEVVEEVAKDSLQTFGTTQAKKSLLGRTGKEIAKNSALAGTYAVGSSTDKEFSDFAKGSSIGLAGDLGLRGIARGGKKVLSSVSRGSGESLLDAANRKGEELIGLGKGSKARDEIVHARKRFHTKNPEGAPRDAADFAVNGSKDLLDEAGNSLQIVTPGAGRGTMLVRTEKIKELSSKQITNVVDNYKGMGDTPATMIFANFANDSLEQIAERSINKKLGPSANHAIQMQKKLQKDFNAEFGNYALKTKPGQVAEELAYGPDILLKMKIRIDKEISELTARDGARRGELAEETVRLMTESLAGTRDRLANEIRETVGSVNPAHVKLLDEANSAYHLASNVSEGLAGLMDPSLATALMASGQKGLTLMFTMNMIAKDFASQGLAKGAVSGFAGKALYDKFGKSTVTAFQAATYEKLKDGSLAKYVGKKSAQKLKKAYLENGVASLSSRVLTMLNTNEGYAKQMSGVLEDEYNIK